MALATVVITVDRRGETLLCTQVNGDSVNLPFTKANSYPLCENDIDFFKPIPNNVTLDDVVRMLADKLRAPKTIIRLVTKTGLVIDTADAFDRAYVNPWIKEMERLLLDDSFAHEDDSSNAQDD